MRTLRLSLAGTVIILLLGGLGGAVLAQSDDAEMPVPNGVVITQVESSSNWPGATLLPGADYAVVDGLFGTNEWDATDPRLSGTATYIGRWHRYPKLYGVHLEAGIWTVTNEDGAWRGESRGISSPNAAHASAATAVLVGEGDYEGLTAYLIWDFAPGEGIAHEEGTIRGIVIADDLPPFPEPPAE